MVFNRQGVNDGFIEIAGGTAMVWLGVLCESHKHSVGAQKLAMGLQLLLGPNGHLYVIAGGEATAFSVRWGLNTHFSWPPVPPHLLFAGRQCPRTYFLKSATLPTT